MARIRTIHPNICEDEKLAEVDDPQLELFFIRLWMHLDDEGRCAFNPRLIKAALFPLVDRITAESICTYVEQLRAFGFVHLYEVEGKVFMHVPTFKTYQKPNRPVPSKVPAPPNPVDSVTEHCGCSEYAVSVHG